MPLTHWSNHIVSEICIITISLELNENSITKLNILKIYHRELLYSFSIGNGIEIRLLKIGFRTNILCSIVEIIRIRRWDMINDKNVNSLIQNCFYNDICLCMLRILCTVNIHNYIFIMLIFTHHWKLADTSSYVFLKIDSEEFRIHRSS